MPGSIPCRKNKDNVIEFNNADFFMISNYELFFTNEFFKFSEFLFLLDFVKVYLFNGIRYSNLTPIKIKE